MVSPASSSAVSALRFMVPRQTEDVDMVVDFDRENLIRLAEAMLELNARTRAEATSIRQRWKRRRRWCTRTSSPRWK